MRICHHKGGLPQGRPHQPGPIQPGDYRIDARLAGLAAKFQAAYTRYADDITFSFPTDDRQAAAAVIVMTKRILDDFDYDLHQDKKLRIWRSYDCQIVTGLVVNETVNLPRRKRRWLRAVEHHLQTGRPATLTPNSSPAGRPSTPWSSARHHRCSAAPYP